ncbi:MAG TPA: hypothetical protein VFZ21_21895, partial [Gemmatimonadaceae bacterium]|nr:hypothetical protein [Gemmatimonadaceae bacterium]
MSTGTRFALVLPEFLEEALAWRRSIDPICAVSMMDARLPRPIVARAHLSGVPLAEQIMAMPAFAPPPHGPSTGARRRWTAAEVRRIIADSPLAAPRYEFVDGELLVTPSPNWPHQRAV